MRDFEPVQAGCTGSEVYEQGRTSTIYGGAEATQSAPSWRWLCARGDYITGLLTDRLQHLATALSGDGTARLSRFISDDAIDEMDEFLLSIKGVGPRVLATFKVLRNIQ